MHKICIFLLVLFCGFVSQAQVKPAAQDTVKTGFSIGKVKLKTLKVFFLLIRMILLQIDIFILILLMDFLSIIL